jgi:hypothetical protein
LGVQEKEYAGVPPFTSTAAVPSEKPKHVTGVDEMEALGDDAGGSNATS